MAAKRFIEDSTERDDHTDKKPKNRLSFASCVREVWNTNNLINMSLMLEPMLRRVVQEEIHNALTGQKIQITKSPSFRLYHESRTLSLVFGNKLALPIFTGNKLLDVEGNSLQIMLVDSKNDIVTGMTSIMKVEIMVLNGDFPSNDAKSWTREEFEQGIVKERKGKRPLLAGDSLIITLRDGTASLGDIELTDNSSWIRSRKFRIGARVATGGSNGFTIHEAITEAFVVKDHRGELYKKHYPPLLKDEVWRLEKIGKDGAFHKKLTQNKIKDVQDFLKLLTINKGQLRHILGNGMSDRMWEVTVKHVKTCDIGNKQYILRSIDGTATFTPICQLVNANINGRMCSTEELSSPFYQNYVNKFIKDAYENWDSLEEVTVGSGSEFISGYPMIAYCGDNQMMQRAVTNERYLTYELEDEGNQEMENEDSQLTTPYQPSFPSEFNYIIPGMMDS